MSICSPSPAMSSRRLGQVWWAMAKPRTRVAMSFTGLSRAAMPTTTLSPSASSPTERKYSSRPRAGVRGVKSIPL